MKFTKTNLAGAFLIELEEQSDSRGFFARTYCREEFEQAGLNPEIAQCSTSFNLKAGTLRGMHYQIEPHAECKLIRCTRGAVFDVLVDLRPDSPSYRHWYGTELTAENNRLLYAPQGLAHGFLTLEDFSEVFYQISVPYNEQASRGVRYDDPVFGILWPRPIEIVSDKDKQWKLVTPGSGQEK